jgi:hypothetical protein
LILYFFKAFLCVLCSDTSEASLHIDLKTFRYRAVQKTFRARFCSNPALGWEFPNWNARMNVNEGPSDDFEKDEGVEEEDAKSQTSAMDGIYLTDEI